MNIDDRVRDRVWFQVDDLVWRQVRHQVERQAWHWVRDQVRFDQIGNQVRIRVLDQMREDHHEH
jgi:hypothetical protein